MNSQLTITKRVLIMQHSLNGIKSYIILLQNGHTTSCKQTPLLPVPLLAWCDHIKTTSAYQVVKDKL